MKITEIENKKVKISPHSITVKNDEGKTCGVVKNTVTYKNLSPSKHMEYWKIVKQTGIWGDQDSLINNFVICDGEAYYLHNLSLKAFLEEYNVLDRNGNVLDHSGIFDYDIRRLKKLEQIAKQASEFVTVIPCYVEH